MSEKELEEGFRVGLGREEIAKELEELRPRYGDTLKRLAE